MSGYQGELPRVADIGGILTECVCNREKRCAYHGKGGTGEDPDIDTPVEFLTEKEKKLIDALSDVMVQFRIITAIDKTRKDDLREVAHHIHALQNAVLAQAAARAYPEDYRLLGETWV